MSRFFVLPFLFFSFLFLLGLLCYPFCISTFHFRLTMSLLHHNLAVQLLLSLYVYIYIYIHAYIYIYIYIYIFLRDPIEQLLRVSVGTSD